MGLNLGQSVTLHLRVGHRIAVWLVIGPFLVLAAIDVIRYRQLHLAFTPALQRGIFQADLTDWLHVLTIVGLFALVIPVGIAAIRIASGAWEQVAGWLGRRYAVLTYTYLFSCLALGVGYVVLASFQVQSGYREIGGVRTYNFVSFYVWTMSVGPIPLLRITLTAMLTLLLIPVWESWLTERPLPRLQQYWSNAVLADLEGPYHPQHGRHRLNLNAGAIAPRARHVVTKIQRATRNYEQLLASSPEAREFLLAVWARCRTRLGRVVDPAFSNPDNRVMLFDNTSRSLEVLTRLCGAKIRLIVSPYEHPSEHAVAEWLQKTGAAAVHVIKVDVGFFDLPVEDQRSTTLNGVMEGLAVGETNVLLISEVCYATGLRTDLTVVDRIRSKLPENTTLFALVDGAHAAGNVERIDGLRYADAYVFSGHKWLMAPEPCAVALVRSAVHQGMRVYDAIDESKLPAATVGSQKLLGFDAALEMLERLGPQRRWNRSQRLLDRFRASTSNTLMQVGSGSGAETTCMATFRPIHGVQWKYETTTRLSEYLCGRGILAQILDLDPDHLWVRLVFPYFLDGTDLDRVAKTLVRAVRSV